MTMEDQYNVGDSVTVGGVTGVVEDVTMRLTRFRGVDGTMYIIPNGDIRLVGNLSRGWARAVVDLTLPGASAADLDTVRRVIEEAAHRVAVDPAFASHCTEPPHLVGLLAADSSTITHAGDAPHRPVPTRRARPGPCASRRSSHWRRRTSGRPRPRRLRPRRR